MPQLLFALVAIGACKGTRCDCSSIVGVRMRSMISAVVLAFGAMSAGASATGNDLLRECTSALALANGVFDMRGPNTLERANEADLCLALLHGFRDGDTFGAVRAQQRAMCVPEAVERMFLFDRSRVFVGSDARK